MDLFMPQKDVKCIYYYYIIYNKNYNISYSKENHKYYLYLRKNGATMASLLWNLWYLFIYKY